MGLVGWSIKKKRVVANRGWWWLIARHTSLSLFLPSRLFRRCTARHTSHFPPVAHSINKQVRTIFPTGANRDAPACTQHAAYAFTLLGPGSHSCANVGRDHKSNFVYYVLDFSASRSSARFCQKCYDPDCKGFRSPWAPLPAEVWQQQRLLDSAAAFNDDRERGQREQPGGAAEAAAEEAQAVGEQQR